MVSGLSASLGNQCHHIHLWSPVIRLTWCPGYEYLSLPHSVFVGLWYCCSWYCCSWYCCSWYCCSWYVACTFDPCRFCVLFLVVLSPLFLPGPGFLRVVLFRFPTLFSKLLIRIALSVVVHLAPVSFLFCPCMRQTMSWRVVVLTRGINFDWNVYSDFRNRRKIHAFFAFFFRCVCCLTSFLFLFLMTNNDGSTGPFFSSQWCAVLLCHTVSAY